MAASSNEPVDFHRYYTQLSFEVPLVIEGYEIDDERRNEFVIYANAQKLYFESPSLYMGTASDRQSDVSFRAEYDPATRQLDGTIARPSWMSNEEALRVSVLLLQAFLAAYFDNAGDASRFSPW